MQFEQMGNFRFYLEQVINDLENQGFRSAVKQVHHESQEYLRSKKLNYSGLDYIDQLERNTIYLGEASSHVVRETAKYVCFGIPKLTAGMVPQYVNDLRAGVIPAVQAHLAFLQRGCSGCEYHAGHARWSNLKAERDRKKSEVYVDELEFSIVYYQDLFRVTQSFMMSMLQQPQLAGAGSRLPVDEVASEIGRRVDLRIQLYTGNVYSSGT